MIDRAIFDKFNRFKMSKATGSTMYTWIVLGISALVCFLSACNPPRVMVAERRSDTEEHGRVWKLRESVLSLGMQQLGIAYLRGGKNPKGFDCSGLVYFVFKSNGLEAGACSTDQCILGEEIPLAEAQPGDLLFFGNSKSINHVAILTTNTKDNLSVLHSTSSKGVIHENIIKSDYWIRRLKKAVRFESYLRSEPVAYK